MRGGGDARSDLLMTVMRQNIVRDVIPSARITKSHTEAMTLHFKTVLDQEQPGQM